LPANAAMKEARREGLKSLAKVADLTANLRPKD
jgi:hypothetical protein